jgi:hypothetical protein
LLEQAIAINMSLVHFLNRPRDTALAGAEAGHNHQQCHAGAHPSSSQKGAQSWAVQLLLVMLEPGMTCLKLGTVSESNA